MKQCVLLLYGVTALILALFSESSSASTATEAFANKDYATAKKLFSAKLPNVEAIFFLGRIAFEEADYDAAEDYFSKVLDSNSENADYHYWIARTFSNQAANASIFSAPGYASDALKHYKQALEIDRKHILAMQGLIGFYREAPAIAGGSLKKAIALAEKLEAVNYEEGLTAKVGIYRSDEDSEAELTTAGLIAKQDDPSSTALLTAGFSFQNHKQYEKAIELFKRATTATGAETGNSKLAAQYQVGRTAVLSGKFTQRGIKALEDYLTQNISKSLPDKEWASYRLAALYHRDGQIDKARQISQRLMSGAEDKSLRKRAKLLFEEIKS